MQRWNRPAVIALAGAAFLLLVIAVVSMTRGNGIEEDKLSDEQVAGKAAVTPEKRCAAQHTYDVIKRELFRRAAETRGSDQAAFDKLSAYAVVRMERPVLKANDESIGAVRCSGRLSLDLPPGVAVVGSRRTLTADIGYTLQAAADGTGDVVVLEGADAIVVPLATLARISNAPLSNVPVPTPVGEAPLGSTLPMPAPAPPVAEPPPVSAGPSFNCANARTRGEIAVCNNGGLASLDSQMAAQFARAYQSADPAQRQLLQSTRTRFLAYRDRCRSEGCMAEAYRGRMREIADIMAGRWNP